MRSRTFATHAALLWHHRPHAEDQRTLRVQVFQQRASQSDKGAARTELLQLSEDRHAVTSVVDLATRARLATAGWRLARSQGCEPGTPGAEAATPSRRSTILQPKCPLSPPHSACRHEQVHAFAQTSIQYRRLVRCRPPTLGAPRRGRSDHRGIDWTKTKPISRRIASMVLKDAIMPSRTCSYALLLVSLSILLGGILACSASCIRACAQIVTARPL